MPIIIALDLDLQNYFDELNLLQSNASETTFVLLARVSTLSPGLWFSLHEFLSTLKHFRTNRNTDFSPSRKSNANTTDMTSILIYCFDRIRILPHLDEGTGQSTTTTALAMLLDGKVRARPSGEGDPGEMALIRLGELDIGQVAATGGRCSSVCAGSTGMAWPRGKAQTVGAERRCRGEDPRPCRPRRPHNTARAALQNI